MYVSKEMQTKGLEKSIELSAVFFMKLDKEEKMKQPTISKTITYAMGILG